MQFVYFKFDISVFTGAPVMLTSNSQEKKYKLNGVSHDESFFIKINH